jgi:hypothetical protein
LNKLCIWTKWSEYMFYSMNLKNYYFFVYFQNRSSILVYFYYICLWGERKISSHRQKPKNSKTTLARAVCVPKAQTLKPILRERESVIRVYINLQPLLKLNPHSLCYFQNPNSLSRRVLNSFPNFYLLFLF